MSIYKMKTSVITVLKRLFIVSLAGLLMSSVVADDTDIIKAETPLAPQNVLFVFDNSGSMKKELRSERNARRVEDSRLGVLRFALGKALDAIAIDPDIAQSGINIGMMNFSGHNGKWLAHGPSYPVTSIKANAQAILSSNGSFTHRGTSYQPAVVNPSSDTSIDYLKTISNQWRGKGKTPLVDSLYEAALYMKGEAVDRGKKPPSNKRAAHPSTYTGLLGFNTTNPRMVCNYKPCGGDTGVNCNTSMRNCTTATESWNWCGLGSEAACLVANPSYTHCVAQTDSDCSKPCLTRDNDGSCTSHGPEQCTTENYFDCAAPANTTTCEHETCEPADDTTVVGRATYNTPITEQCQSSHIVLLSDGIPTINTRAKEVKVLINNNGGNAGNCNSGSGFGRCGIELATYLANNDHLTTGPNKMGDHPIIVHTIGLSLATNQEGKDAKKYLESLATAGKGTSNFTSDPNELVKMIRGIVGTVADKARSFSSPSYSADPDSLLLHGNDVYLPMFQPTNSSVWSGNLKKFTLLNGKLVDKNNAPATNAKGNIIKHAKDLWSLATDPNESVVTDGGVAKLLDPDHRKQFSDNGALNTSYTRLKQKLGNAGMSDGHRSKLLNFIRGKRLDGTNRYHMGDIIHNKPVQVSYGTNKVIFVGTNEGFVHAFDTATGKEIFAFMPEELLKNIEPQFQAVENSAKSKHLYGVDGKFSLYHDDTNHNNQVDGAEKVILYFGLRRGGKHYYALDVTTPATPKLLWKNRSNAHSWSTPVLAKLKYRPNNAPKPVIIYGGGYSDDASGNEIVGRGNAVYIVDALTGNIVWKTKPAHGITHAVAAPVRVVDVDQNGLADRLYFSTTGGNIWRVDLNASNLNGSGTLNDLRQAKVTKFASLGASHKFFVEPDIAIFKYKGRYVLSLSIGSGERPNPLKTNNDDYFFALFDENIFQLPTSSTGSIDTTQLYNAPATGIDLTSPNRTYKGWKLKLGSASLKGEKVLSSALTFNNMVMFTSFGIGDTTLTPQTCDQSTSNVSSLYVLDLLSGGVTLDLNNDGVIDDKDKPITVAYGEITDTPQIVFGVDSTDHHRSYNIRVGKSVLSFANNKSKSNQPKDSLIPKVYWFNQNAK